MSLVVRPLTPSRWPDLGAIFNARKRGVRLLEGYPVDKGVPAAAQASWFGSKRMFDEAGFEEVVRRRPDRPVVRLKRVDRSD